MFLIDGKSIDREVAEKDLGVLREMRHHYIGSSLADEVGTDRLRALTGAVELLEDLLSAPTWQSVDTAPENVDVLLYCPERHPVCNPARIEFGHFRSVGSHGEASQHSWATEWLPSPTHEGLKT